MARWPLTKEEARWLVERYEEGHSTTSIAREVGLSAPTVGRALHRLGVPLRPSLRERPLRGGRNPNARLTADDVRSIRRRLASGERRDDVGRRFGISRSQLSRIARGESWPEER